MRQRLGRWLRALARWVDPAGTGTPLTPPGHALLILVPRDAVWTRARALTREADGLADGTSGEYKRHVVYARLMKEFPDATKRAIAWAIEASL